jgi:hypothetical protein
MSINKLSPAALKAAMTTGTEGWGRWASATEHAVYVEPINLGRNWRKCPCGCGRRATHKAAANGVALALGCEMSVRRFAKAF